MVGILGILFGGGNGVESLFVCVWVLWLEVEVVEGFDVNFDGELLEGCKLCFLVFLGVLCVYLLVGLLLLCELLCED